MAESKQRLASHLRSLPNLKDEESFPELTQDEILASSKNIITVKDDEEYRILTFEGRRNEVYVLAASLEGSQRVVEQLIGRTAIAALLIALLTGAISWFFVSRFFRPVNQIVEAAHAVALGDFSRQMPNAKKGSEFGELTNAINKMMSSIRQFVSDASHELRTPLTVIRGYSEILQKSNIEKEQRDRAVSRIETESLRMEKLVKDLLTLTKSDSAALINFTNINLSKIIEEYFQDLNIQNPNRQVILNINKNVVLKADEEAIRQLFSNIVQNIIRHTPQDSKVEVNLKQNVDSIEIEIEDSGPGIPQNARNEVFERFSRLDESRSRDTGGFGLGMSIIKSVVDKHQGKIFLEDSKFGGLRIKLIFKN